MTPKIIIHHLDCPAVWQREEAERSRRHRRQALLALVAAASVLTAGALRSPDTVEDYSLRSSGKPGPGTALANAPAPQGGHLLADSRASQ